VIRLFSLATADYLIYNAGDDVSEPNRARRLAEVIARDAPMYLYSNVTDLEGSGDALDRQRTRTRPEALQQKSLPDLARSMSHALGASSAWHRDTFDRFGPIVETNLFEDQVLMYRARLDRHGVLHRRTAAALPARCRAVVPVQGRGRAEACPRCRDPAAAAKGQPRRAAQSRRHYSVDRQKA